MARIHFIAITTVCFYTTFATAVEFTSLTVFGDSLSDVGNIDDATFGLQPGPRYFNGRFSNGPVYSELLAERLGLDPLIATSDGGTNYAFGGGRTSGTSFFEGGFFIRDLDDQIDDFLEDADVDPDGLHIVLAGGNDFVLGNTQNSIATAGRVEDQIERLANAGVQNILSINLPLLGDTPRYADQRDVMNERVAIFNQELDNGLNRVEESFDSLTVFRFDLAELFQQVLGLPSAFGLTNVTDEGIEADDATGYAFWDDVHPTNESHAILAGAVFSLFDEEKLVGDFNYNDEIDSSDVDILAYEISRGSNSQRLDVTEDGMLDVQDIDEILEQAGSLNGDSDLNGEVAFSDFLTLSRNFGSNTDVLWSDGDFDANGEVAFPDFLVLSRNFGDSIAESAILATTVPEPSSHFFTLAAGAIGLGFTRKTRACLNIRLV